MNKIKVKRLMAWILLLTLISIAITLTFFRFFSETEADIQEIPVNDSSSKAIHNALEEITSNFNQNTKVKEYCQQNNVVLKAAVNNYYIYISYITDTTTTYEFTYNNLHLNITVNDDDKIFNVVYPFLIEAIQKRINNTENFEEIINNFLTKDITYEGLSKEKFGEKIEYKINITKKLKENRITE